VPVRPGRPPIGRSCFTLSTWRRRAEYEVSDQAFAPERAATRAQQNRPQPAQDCREEGTLRVRRRNRHTAVSRRREAIGPRCQPRVDSPQSRGSLQRPAGCTRPQARRFGLAERPRHAPRSDHIREAEGAASTEQGLPPLLSFRPTAIPPAAPHHTPYSTIPPDRLQPSSVGK